MISGCFISYNEEKKAKRFFENVRDFVDEIILVDGYSTDKTIEIAKSYGATVFQRKFDGYANQRNYGLERAKYPWRFVMDFDEIVSPKFKTIIPNLLLSRKADCFKIRIYHYRAEDHKIMTIGWKRALFRNYGIFWGDLHERAISFRYEKKVHDKDVFVEEFKTTEERYNNYVKYKKLLLDLYKKYRTNGQILLMNKIQYYLIPDHNSQLKIEIDDLKKRENIIITSQELA